MRSELIHKIFAVEEAGFEALALEVYRYQYDGNPLYRRFCDQLGRTPGRVLHYDEVPYLPIGFFKGHPVKTGQYEAETWFESSGTTGTVNSRHYVRDLEVYRDSFHRGFRLFYGDPADWCILGLLPSYLERQHSSLVVMVDALIKASGHDRGGFYLYDHAALAATLAELEAAGQRTLLFGVSFALLDFAEKHPMALAFTTIIETGGMKGRRKEITRAELHDTLRSAFPGARIHSEYGMTELLSQAYSGDDGLFRCPPWMRVQLREEDDPLQASERAGIINVTDLANLDSCSFIATEDLGRLQGKKAFEVLGRIDHSDIRGCSQLVG